MSCHGVRELRGGAALRGALQSGRPRAAGRPGQAHRRHGAHHRPGVQLRRLPNPRRRPAPRLRSTCCSSPSPGGVIARGLLLPSEGGGAVLEPIAGCRLRG